MPEARQFSVQNKTNTWFSTTKLANAYVVISSYFKGCWKVKMISRVFFNYKHSLILVFLRLSVILKSNGNTLFVDALTSPSLRLKGGVRKGEKELTRVDRNTCDGYN